MEEPVQVYLGGPDDLDPVSCGMELLHDEIYSLEP